MDEKMIRKDRLRYTKNTVSSRLAILAILFNVFYFVSVYKSDVGNYYYTWLTGASIIYNLLFMLIVFLSSEGVKNYKISFSVTLIVTGVLQFVRTQIIPKRAYEAIVKISEAEVNVMDSAQYTRVIIFLCVSGCLLIVAGIIGILKTKELTAYNKQLEAQAKA